MASIAPLFVLLGQAAAQVPALSFHQEHWFRALVAASIMVASWVLGRWLAKVWRMPDYSFRFGIILFSVIAGTVICLWSWPPKLGIDLKGGVILIYELAEDQQNAINVTDPLDRIRADLESLDTKTEVNARSGNQIVITAETHDEEALSQIEQAIAGIPFRNYKVTRTGREPKKDRTAIVFTVSPMRATTADVEMDKLVAALNRRINPGGQKEVTVRKFGEKQVEIIIPEVDPNEIDLIKQKISTAGLLEFRIVANERDHDNVFKLADANPLAKEISEGDRVIAKWVKLNEKNERRPEGAKTRTNRDGETEVLVVVDRWDVTGGYLAHAATGYDERGGPAVKFTFKSEGAVRFGELTGENIPDPATGFERQLGIILDGRLESWANIRSAISTSGEITGVTEERMRFIVEILNAGNLPASLDQTPVSQTSISPQLGEDTIRNGAISMTVSTLAVLLFMLMYYRFSGVVADIAVVINVLLVVAMMITVGAAFTLAGLAGLVLSVGMAVDANVLIYERMREELQRGAALRMAIRNGFGRAMSTIIDSNLTTLLTGVVLYAIGTDQLKGFAITLILGLLLNLYTAVYMGRVIFDVAERRRWISELKMMKMFDAPNLDFVKPTLYAVTFSLVLIVGGMIAAASRGEGLFGIDFTGGTSVQIVLDKDHTLTVGEVRALVDPRDESKTRLEDVTVASVGRSDAEGRSRYYKIDTSISNIEEVKTQLKELFGEKLEVYEMTYTPPEKIAGVAAAASASPNDDEKASSDTTSAQKKSTKTGDEGAKSAKATSQEKEAKANDARPAAKEDTDGKSKTDETNGKSKSDEKQQASSLRTPAWFAWTAAHTLTFWQDDEKAAAPSSGATKEAPSEAKKTKTEADKTNKADEKASDGKGADTAKTNTKDGAVKKDLPAALPKSSLKDASPQRSTPAERPEPQDNTFAGGSSMMLSFKEGINRDALLAKLEASAKDLKLGPAQFLIAEVAETQDAVNSRLFRAWKVQTTLPQGEAQQVLDRVKSQLAQTPVFLGANNIGGKVAGHAQVMAIYAILASMVMIVIYVWVRFQNIVFGLAAVVALVHDVLVTVAALAVSYYVAPFLGWAMVDPFKISLDVVAALLTIVGFSINDTIVIFDRIREIKGKSPEVTADMVNKAVNQTLGRTVLTSGTVLMVTIILYVWGGQEIHPFSFAMLVGLVSGTYSTVYIASPLVLFLRKPSAGAQRARLYGDRAA